MLLPDERLLAVFFAAAFFGLVGERADVFCTAASAPVATLPGIWPACLLLVLLFLGTVGSELRIG
jgi:hypothetical protein